MGLIGESRYYTFGRFCLDTQNDVLLKDGLPVQITHKSFEILHFLAQNPGKMLSKNDFFDIVWSESHVDDTNLTQHIYRIRKVIEVEGSKDVYIETIPKFGYRFVADVETVDSTPIDSNGNGKPGRKDFGDREADVLAWTDDFSNSAPTVSKQVDFETLDDSTKTDPASRPDTNGTNKWRSPVSKRLVLSFIFGILLCFAAMQLFYNLDLLSSDKDNNDLKVAVLPFNQIGDAHDSKLELGMADTIISKVSSLQGIYASPTETIEAYSKTTSNFRDVNPYEVGDQLKVDVVLAGTIQREKEVIRVNMRVYHVTEKRHICSIKFDEVDNGVFSLQDAISERVKKKFVSDLNAHEVKKDGIKYK